VQRLLRAYTIRDTTLVSIIRSDPNHTKMKLEDILVRIINHELLLEEARYVKNLSKGIVSTKNDVVALKSSKKKRRNKYKLRAQVKKNNMRMRKMKMKMKRKSMMKKRWLYSSRNSINA
jgi:hypothetical protein